MPEPTTTVAQVVSALWELPQSSLGFALWMAARATGRVRGEEREHGRRFVEVPGMAVSLGHFVFWSSESTRWHHNDAETRAHEWGHTFQSRVLGPLYLPLVGVPSSARALYAVAYREVTGRRWRGYFDGYPEVQADRYGGVDRAARAARWG